MDKKIATTLLEAHAMGPAEIANLIRQKLAALQILLSRNLNLSEAQDLEVKNLIDMFMKDLGMDESVFPCLKSAVEKERRGK